MNTPDTFGAKMFTRFMRKGWHISFTCTYQDRVCVIPPERLDAQHLFGIYIPVMRHTWQPDLKREWYAALWSKQDKTMHGPKFEVSAHPDDTERFAAFAAWIGDLLRNPEKFT